MCNSVWRTNTRSTVVAGILRSVAIGNGFKALKKYLGNFLKHTFHLHTFL